MHVENSLRECREEKGVSQLEVASATSINSSSICSYESGERVPGLANALRLSAYYRKTVNELFRLAGNKEKSDEEETING